MFHIAIALVLATAAPAVDAAPVSLSPEQAQSASFLLKSWRADYPPEWFERRYGIAPPIVEHQGFSALSGSIRVYYLRATTESDQRKLWNGLVADRTANQALGRKGDTVIWIVAKQDALRTKALGLLHPDESADKPTGLEWSKTELSRDIPGLAFYDEQFLDPLPPLEARAGLRLRGVYQTVYQLQGRMPLGRKIAQVEYWFPQDPKQLPNLVKALDAGKTDEQTILSGKGAAIVTVTRTDDATRILLDQLKEKGYRVESRVPSFATNAAPMAH